MIRSRWLRRTGVLEVLELVWRSRANPSVVPDNDRRARLAGKPQNLDGGLAEGGIDLFG